MNQAELVERHALNRTAYAAAQRELARRHEEAQRALAATYNAAQLELVRELAQAAGWFDEPVIHG